MAIETADVEAFERARERGADVHLLGLVSYGGVHSHIDHLRALLELADRVRAGRLVVGRMARGCAKLRGLDRLVVLLNHLLGACLGVDLDLLLRHVLLEDLLARLGVGAGAGHHLGAALCALLLKARGVTNAPMGPSAQ